MLTSSVSARIAVTHHTLYAASKAAVSAMAPYLAPELARREIAVNAIAPGGTVQTWQQRMGRSTPRQHCAASPHPIRAHRGPKVGLCLKALPDFTGLYYVSNDSITGDLNVMQAETDRVQTYYRTKYRFQEWSSRRRRQVDLPLEGAGISVAVFVECRASDLSALADTLDAFAHLPDPGWTLTVLSPDPSPDTAFETEPQLAWRTYDSHEDYAAGRGKAVREAGADWIAIIEPGDRPAPSLLRDLGAYIRSHHECRLVYTDEDSQGDTDKSVTLRLKPDWNADLQRSSFYVGKLCLVQRTALQEVGGAGEFLHAYNDDIVWRIWSRFGDHAIGHISEVLVTSAAVGKSAAPTTGCLVERRRVLDAHLARCRIDAIIADGPVPGTFDVQYPLIDEPLVSLLIPAETDATNLARCIASILENTDYAHFEILIGVPPGLRDRTAALVTGQFGDRQGLRVVLVPDDRGQSRQMNCLAEQAGGEVLLFMRDQMVVLQPAWLRRMLAHCTRPGVGLVGARIVNQRRALVHAGITLGLGSIGVGARVNEGMHLSSPGYMNFNQVTREVGAVSSLCMMMTAAAFTRTGGFSHELRIPLYCDVDFSQRVRAAGQKVVWTPHATLMYSGEQNQVDGFAHSRDQLREEADYLHTHWLNVLARDPGYHLQLGLRSQRFGQDIDFPCGWNPDLDRRPKVIAAGTGSVGSWYYRGLQPIDCLTRDGLVHSTLVRFPRGGSTLAIPSVVDLQRMQPDTLLLHNTVHDAHIEALMAYRKHSDVFIVFGQDDLMFALPQSNPFAKTVYKDMKKRLRRCLDLSDRLVVTTEPLADALGDWIDDVQIIPNYLDETVWAHLVSQRSTGGKPRVGWAGASQHAGDLRLLEDVVKETASEVDWVFFGMCPPALRPFVTEIHAGVALDAYPAELATLNLDLALAPLEYNRFNEAKSNLRILEYGAFGWPVIATDIEPYRNAPVSRVKNHPRAWINAIREHIHDDAAARRAGERLKQWVADRWMLQSHREEWLRALSPVQTVPQSRIEMS